MSINYISWYVKLTCWGVNVKDKDVDCDDFMNPTLPCTAPVLQILSRNGGGFFLGLLVEWAS